MAVGAERRLVEEPRYVRLYNLTIFEQCIVKRFYIARAERLSREAESARILT